MEFLKTVEDVALLAKALIKKDLYDSATIHFAADIMLEICRKGPILSLNLFFIKLINGKYK